MSDEEKMKVKARKVGNSMVVTIPNAIAEEMALYDGQELTIRVSGSALEYVPVRPASKKVDWENYDILQQDLREGMSSREYVARMRDEER